MVARVRWLMLISGVTTLVAIAAVLGVIGYRLFKTEGSAAPGEVTALLPKNARIIATALSGERIVVTVEVGGAIEIRTFDAHTLRPSREAGLRPAVIGAICRCFPPAPFV